MSYIPAALRRLVVERANNRCEYCQLPDNVGFYPHELDHAIAQKHQGKTEADNLVLACWRCNRHKGSDLGSFDPETGAFSFLFNPRTQQWSEHFRSEQGEIKGLTPAGRTTERLLQFNLPERVKERQFLDSLNQNKN
ncbi:HNH endonuclease signature motif containing protein [Spirulina major CS-329]|uniref:HNH endonuclease n=1 Tax=Spirulina TaxID=1154 RepID=UPI00232D9EE1|nr:MULTISPECIES: HNH endonuclease signature motif containing protein [Spirulina]MDB9493077.1 HNH endonuclease signature motif containing protein [Spirulina subsalsa CS-330]MDB9503588.1 HNH endonuclease signature motif containing protein [Spirulina major CS-329]